MAEPAALCVTVRFLGRLFHGRTDGGEPEWPPSPLRLFQALVAAAGRRELAVMSERSVQALEWLERQPAPTIVAPRAKQTAGRELSVPNNAMDVVAAAWARGNESEKGDADPRTHRTMKTVRPSWLAGDTVRYLWPADPTDGELERHKSKLRELARSVCALGWGIDVVIGDCAIMPEPELTPDQERWFTDDVTTSEGLRVPVEGSLNELRERYRAFTKRVGPEGFTAPPPLSTFRVVTYRRSSDLVAQPFAAFLLLRPEQTGYCAFDSARTGLTVAGMLRGATAAAARNGGWTEQQIATWVLGHGEARGAAHVPVGPARFAYLPLPSIEVHGDARIVGRVRRILVTSAAEQADEKLNWIRNALAAQELIDERSQKTVALLSGAPGDFVLQRYTCRASAWVSVTPVVLPGHDDPNQLRRRIDSTDNAPRRRQMLDQLDARIDALLRKALLQSGFSSGLVKAAELEWRKVPFIAGAEPAGRYAVPHHLKRLPRFHVRLRFRDAHGQAVQVPGPLCIGSGRFLGLGLFTAAPDGS